ncbi:transcription initiation factor IIB [Gaertneriomyces sp. JEL0708]|nr:transcription initiation factor IIB [Gaertneriomyces sp. JEL0708]
MPIEPQVPQQDLNLRLVCTDCRDPVPNIVEEFSQGDLVCGNCGLVLGNRIIDTRSEWRTFSNSDDNSDDPSRVGSASDPLLSGMNFIDSTIISQRDGGSGKARELNRAHGKATGQKAEKEILAAFKEIQTMCDRIGLPKTVSDHAKHAFKIADQEKVAKGKPPQNLMAACIYLACREYQSTRTFKEICALTKVPKKDIGRLYKQLLPIVKSPNKPGETAANEISMDAFVIRFANALQMDNDVIKGARHVLHKSQDLGTLAGKSPISIVAGCLYFVSCLAADGKKKSAKEIAAVAGCTDATLKNAYKLLYDTRDELGKGLVMPKTISDLPVP